MSTRYLFVSGHLTDGPGRAPRFPEERVDAVDAELRHALQEWDVGPGWTLVTGGARGADLLAAKAALDRGADVRICLALPREEFVRRSVQAEVPDPGRDWVALFDEVLAASRVDLPPEHPPANLLSGTVAQDEFERANDWMMNELAGRDVYGLVVWNGASGNTGGTWQVIAQLDHLTRHDSGRLKVVDPTPRRYEARQPPGEQKKILALDGGGIRGVITLEILRRVEQQLRTELDDPRLVLADYFDYMAGTSTGAIIATGLAQGRSVEDLSEAYHQLGSSAFRRTAGSVLQMSRFSSSAIEEQLARFFGDDRTLGDPDFETLLLMVMHNTSTDSPWLLSNNTQAKYNRPDRLLPGNEDRNLDIRLTDLVRATTAAPTYFVPQTIRVGEREFSFADGGITAFNNPALIAVVMATLPAYGLGWDRGADRLLVVSVGTGSAAAASRRAHRTRPMQALDDVRRLIPFFMNGASFSQDLLCRVFGECRHGPAIDTEVGTLVHPVVPRQGSEPGPTALGLDVPTDSIDPGDLPGVGHLFSYVRYDASLRPNDLDAAGVPPRYHRAVRQLAAVRRIPEMVRIGRHAAGEVSVSDHFRGFLPEPTRRPPG